MITLTSKITVITVCYNAEKHIEKTIKSILSQDYPNIEYIIVDGKSNDKTMDVVYSYKNKITKIISEPDNGIYEAMNKGIKFASGDWIIFINAGDELVSSETISMIFEGKMYNSDIIFGDVLNRYEWGDVRVKGRAFNGVEPRMPFCHQCVFVRRNILRDHLFNESYKICGDHNLFYTLYKEGYSFKHIDQIISIFDTTGISNYTVQGFKEVSLINNYKGFDYLKRLLRIRLKKVLVAILPDTIFNYYRRYKYNKNSQK